MVVYSRKEQWDFPLVSTALVTNKTYFWNKSHDKMQGSHATKHAVPVFSFVTSTDKPTSLSSGCVQA